MNPTAEGSYVLTFAVYSPLSHTSKCPGRVAMTLQASAMSVLRPEDGGSIVLLSALYLCRSTYRRYVSTSPDVLTQEIMETRPQTD